MTSDPKTIEPDATLDDAVGLMQAMKVRHLPVVRGSWLIGIVTWTDLMRTSPPRQPALRARGASSVLRKAHVADVMTADPMTVSPDVPVEVAARMLRDHKIGALPVVEHGMLVGIVTESDLFSVLVHLLGGDLRGARVSLDLSSGLADLTRVISVLKRIEGIERGLTMVVRLDADSRRGYLRLATTSPLVVADQLASAGLDLSDFRVDLPARSHRAPA
jgi:acetoin utilization protein AcuB